MEDLLDLDLAATEINSRVDSWTSQGIAVSDITWREQGNGWPPTLETDGSTVIDADSVGVRLAFGNAVGGIVVFKGGWADFEFWSGAQQDEPVLDAPGYGDPMSIEQFASQLDRLFALFESTGNTASELQSVTHDPARDSNFVLQIDLETHGSMPGRQEQVWAKQLDATRFELRSIPFFAYGMAPGDVLETTPDLALKSVIRGRNHVLRIALPREIAAEYHERIHGELVALDLNHEWKATGYVAIELPDSSVPPTIQSLLAEVQQRGAHHEISTIVRPAS